MDFELNEEQQLLRNSTRDFLTSECPKSVVRELEESESGHSLGLWKKMADLGWMGIAVPEEYGGVGLGLMELAVLFEEFGRAAMPGPLFATAMGCLLVAEAGSDDQKKSVLPRVASGELILTLALEEPEAVNDPRFTALRASEKGDGYIINGSKLFVPYANIADYLMVVARTGGMISDAAGLSILVVDGKAKGVTCTPLKTITGDRQYRVDFESVSVASTDVIGERDGAFPAVRAILDKAMAIQCAEMVGGAQQELEMTAKYTKTRVQFDRPIGAFQAVQHRLADMYIDANAARWTTCQALWRLSEGMPTDRELSIAKAVTSRACQRVAFNAQQLHGGIGVDLDYDLQFYYRRGKAFELKFGTTSNHLEALGASI